MAATAWPTTGRIVLQANKEFRAVCFDERGGAVRRHGGDHAANFSGSLSALKHATRRASFSPDGQVRECPTTTRTVRGCSPAARRTKRWRPWAEKPCQ